MPLKYCLLLFAFLLSMHFLPGQSLKEKYEKETVYWQGNKLMRDGQKLKVRDFKLELLRYQDSSVEFRWYQKYDRVSWVWYGASVIGVLATTTAADRSTQNLLAVLFARGDCTHCPFLR